MTGFFKLQGKGKTIAQIALPATSLVDEPMVFNEPGISLIARPKSSMSFDTGSVTLHEQGPFVLLADSDLLPNGNGPFHGNAIIQSFLDTWSKEGVKALDKLRGGFALALFDRRNSSLSLIRDRLGIKPIHWAVHEGILYFGNELDPLLESGVPAKVDAVSMWQYLSFFCVPAPYSAITNAGKVEPGSMITFGDAGPKETTWYHIPAKPTINPASGSVENRLNEILDASIVECMSGANRVGCFLSGGLDSSIVSAVTSRHQKGLPTFCVGFKQDSFFDESAHAEEVARHLGTEHTTFKLGREELAEAYLKLLGEVDEPYADSSALPARLLCQKVAPMIDVALGGDGSDELFGGYTKHQAELRYQESGNIEKLAVGLAPLWRRLPKQGTSATMKRIRQLDRFASLAHLPRDERFLHLASFVPFDVTRNLIASPPEWEAMATRNNVLSSPIREISGLNGVLLGDVRLTLPNDQLYKTTLATKGTGLKVRAPFLGYDVVEFAFGLPATAKFNKGESKAVLRSTFGHLLPRATLTRPKHGFESPMSALFRAELHTTISEILLDQDAVNAAGLDFLRVKSQVEQLHSTKPGTAQATIHALLVYMAWWKRSILPRLS